MAISRMQEPRQLYGLGSLVKSIGKTVKKVVKSPIGKAALIGLGGAGLMGMGPLSGLGGIGSRIGGALFGGSALPPSMGLGKSTGIIGSLLGKIPGGGYTVGAIGSILAASGMSPEEIEETKRDPEKVKIYLRDYYSKTNPDASAEEVEEFVTTNTSEYAVGGRVGFANGKNMKMASMDENEKEFERLVDDFMERGFSLQEAIEEAKDTLERKSIAIGGRVGLEAGANKDFQEYLKGREEFNKKQNAEQLYKEYLENKRRQKVAEQKTMAANGGLMPTGVMRANKAGTIERDYRETGGFVPVGIKEKADDVPAMLSKNEFVMTADAVRGMGDGNIEKGAQRLYDQMKTMEKRVV